MIPSNTRIWIAADVTDMRSGFNSLAAKVQTVLDKDPYSGHVFVFRGKRGDLLKCLWWCDGGRCLLSKRLEKGRFAWPRADTGVVALTTAQLALLLEGFDWRQPVDAARARNALKTFIMCGELDGGVVYAHCMSAAPTDLPDDIEALKAMVASLREHCAASPSAGGITCSPAPTPVANVPPRCTA